MADQISTPVAESSTAQTTAQVEVPTVPTDPSAYAEWRQTGKVPEAKPEAKATEKPKPGEPATPDNSEAGKKAASTEKQEPKRHAAADRVDELLGIIRDAGFTPAELRTYKRELKQAEPPPVKAPETTAKPAGLEAPVKPKVADFETYDLYEEARDKYFEDLSDYKVAKALETDRSARAQEAQQREIAKRIDETEGRRGKETKPVIVKTIQTVLGDKDIPTHVKDFIGESSVVPDLLYVMGSDPAELAEFVELAHTNPNAALRKIVALESLVQAELAKGGNGTARGEDGKFVPAKPAETKAPEKKAPEVPPPPKELSGRGSAPPDELESALKTGDFRAFREVQNRRDIAKIRGS